MPLILLLLYNLLAASPSDEGTSVTCSCLFVNSCDSELGWMCDEIKELFMSLLRYEILGILQKIAVWFGFT